MNQISCVRQASAEGPLQDTEGDARDNARLRSYIGCGHELEAAFIADAASCQPQAARDLPQDASDALERITAVNQAPGKCPDIADPACSRQLILGDWRHKHRFSLDGEDQQGKTIHGPVPAEQQNVFRQATDDGVQSGRLQRRACSVHSFGIFCY